LSKDACRHTPPIFDGHQRYDLKIAFKRVDKVTAENGYAGPVVAGHCQSRLSKIFPKTAKRRWRLLRRSPAREN
jgi:hypothetical protein